MKLKSAEATLNTTHGHSFIAFDLLPIRTRIKEQHLSLIVTNFFLSVNIHKVIVRQVTE